MVEDQDGQPVEPRLQLGAEIDGARKDRRLRRGRDLGRGAVGAGKEPDAPGRRVVRALGGHRQPAPALRCVDAEAQVLAEPARGSAAFAYRLDRPGRGARADLGRRLGARRRSGTPGGQQEHSERRQDAVHHNTLLHLVLVLPGVGRPANMRDPSMLNLMVRR
jgi:hypothetical protein